MTNVYFVRHCQSRKGWKQSDSIRPLTELGASDSELVTGALRSVKLDYCICSPYLRSMDTIRGCAEAHGIEIHTDARLGERISGSENNSQTLKMHWENHEYHEPDGECIASVRKRNIEALCELLNRHSGESILFGTHGTALSAILNYYEPDFGYDEFMELYGWMPYIIHAVFDGARLVTRENLLIVNRGY